MKKLLAALITLTIVLVMLEALLHVFDPYGMSYFYDTGAVARYTQDVSDELYILNPGTHKLHNFTLTVTNNHTRLVPDTHPAACQVVAIGDSVTMGHGVNDAETWVNHLAQQFPDVEFINAGVNGYNSRQVMLSIDRFPDADGFIYYIVNNDMAETVLPTRENKRSTYTAMYLQFVLVRTAMRGEAAPLNERFWNDIDALLSMDNLVAFNMDTNIQGELGDRAMLLTWDEVISIADPHPTPGAHEAIAQGMHERVGALIDQVCK